MQIIAFTIRPDLNYDQMVSSILMRQNRIKFLILNRLRQLATYLTSVRSVVTYRQASSGNHMATRSEARPVMSGSVHHCHLKYSDSGRQSDELRRYHSYPGTGNCIDSQRPTVWFLRGHNILGLSTSVEQL